MIKKTVKTIIANVVYLLYKSGVLKNKIKVLSIDETIDELLNTEKSLVRFGDGEITMISGENLKLEKFQPELTESMKRIIRYEHENLMVAIVDVFQSLDVYRKESRQFWKDYLLVRRKNYRNLCATDKVYGNAFVSRCYNMYVDKSQCVHQFEKIRQIWKGKDVVVIEGAATHNGVGNNLFSTARSVERIIGPSQNAYLKIEEIYAACVRYPKDRLILVSLGAAAKPLVEKLFLQGYRVLDIGNIDMEYEWYLAKAVNKMPISKHQICGKEANLAAGYEEYWKQIKVIIEND